MKKLFMFVLATASILSCLAFSASAKITENGDFEYKVLHDNTIRIVEYLGENENVVIPKKIDNKKVTEIGDSAFSNRKLKSVTVSENVKYIDEYAFSQGAKNKSKIKIIIKNPECNIACYKFIPENATIIGYKNSTAQKYAKRYGYKFEVLKPEEKVWGIEVKKRGRTYLSLKWEKIDGADKYQIYVSTNNKKWKKAGESRTNSFKLSNLKASTWYYVKIRAIKDGDKCKFSSVYKTATKPKTPQDIKVKLTKNDNVKVSWDKQSKVAGYKIYYSTDKNFNKNVKFVYATGGNPDSYIFKNLKKSKTYYFKLTAYKVKETDDHKQEYIESSFSKTVSIKVK